MFSRGSVLATLQSKLLSGAVGVVFGLLGKLGDKAAINAAAEYLSGAVYQLYRHLYRAAGGNEAYFSLDPAACTMDTAAADMKLAQVRFARALRSLNARKVEFPDLSPGGLDGGVSRPLPKPDPGAQHHGCPPERAQPDVI